MSSTRWGAPDRRSQGLPVSEKLLELFGVNGTGRPFQARLGWWREIRSGEAG